MQIVITDIFINRYSDIQLNLANSFLVQLFNLYDDPHVGIRPVLLDKVDGYKDSGFADEHIRIIAQSMHRLCNELGCKDLDKSEYEDPNWGYKEYRVIKNYIFDTSINPIEKLSLLEILFRETEHHILSEVKFLEGHIPEYEARSEQIKEMSAQRESHFYNDGEEKLKKAKPQLAQKKEALHKIQEQINQRLKLHKLPLAYHNGFFQKSADPVIEQQVAQPFWALVSNPKYKNVETDMLEAVHRYDTGGRDPALYAAKALESMIKIVCGDIALTTGKETGAAAFLSHLAGSKSGPVLIKDEHEELLSMFRIRNDHGHGPGTAPMPNLSSQQELRYVHSAMVWIHSLSKR